MRKCIFCNRTEKDFENGNSWTIEHIIPEALGNKTLKIYDVCKECNSKLGTCIDGYFVNNELIKIVRQSLKIPNKNGTIPNAFKEGKDAENHLIRVNDSFQPRLIPYTEIDGSIIRIGAPSSKIAKEIAYKILKRMNYSDEQISKFLENAVYKSNSYQPVINFNFEIDLNRFCIEALKIAYEYAFFKLGNLYLNDTTAKKIRNYLYKVIDGKMENKHLECPYVLNVNQNIENILKKFSIHNYHMLSLNKNIKNQVIVYVILFMESVFSFCICVSENAELYDIPSTGFNEIIHCNIKNNT